MGKTATLGELGRPHPAAERLQVDDPGGDTNVVWDRDSAHRPSWWGPAPSPFAALMLTVPARTVHGRQQSVRQKRKKKGDRARPGPPGSRLARVPEAPWRICPVLGTTGQSPLHLVCARCRP